MRISEDDSPFVALAVRSDALEERSILCVAPFDVLQPFAPLSLRVGVSRSCSNPLVDLRRGLELQLVLAAFAAGRVGKSARQNRGGDRGATGLWRRCVHFSFGQSGPEVLPFGVLVVLQAVFV